MIQKEESRREYYCGQKAISLIRFLKTSSLKCPHKLEKCSNIPGGFPVSCGAFTGHASGTDQIVTVPSESPRNIYILDFPPAAVVTNLIAGGHDKGYKKTNILLIIITTNYIIALFILPN